MNNRTINDYTRVSKQAAQKRAIAGDEVYIYPVNLYPVSFWDAPALIPKCKDKTAFTQFVNMYEYYNCIDNQTGKYSAFYIKGV